MDRTDLSLSITLTIVFLVTESFATERGDNRQHPPPGGYEYRLITAESQMSIENTKLLCNLGGTLAVIYDKNKVAFGNDNGINGIRWRGWPDRGTDPFTIAPSDMTAPEKFRHKRIAYDLDGKVPTIVLEVDQHKGAGWEQIMPKEEWWKKYNKTHARAFHLRATQGKFKGYYLTFAEPEMVTVEKDRTYVRRKAILTKEPTEMSVLLKLEIGER